MLLTVCPVNQISNNSQSFVEVKVNNANYPLLKLTIALVYTVSEIKHMTRDFDSRFSRRRVLDNSHQIIRTAKSALSNALLRQSLSYLKT